MPRWVGDVLEAIFIIALGAIVFYIFYLIFNGGTDKTAKSGSTKNLGGLGARINDFADDVMDDAQDDITIAPRFTSHLMNGVSTVSSFLLK